jgi:hypothetical protein
MDDHAGESVQADGDAGGRQRNGLAALGISASPAAGGPSVPARGSRSLRRRRQALPRVPIRCRHRVVPVALPHERHHKPAARRTPAPVDHAGVASIPQSSWIASPGRRSVPRAVSSRKRHPSALLRRRQAQPATALAIARTAGSVFQHSALGQRQAVLSLCASRRKILKHNHLPVLLLPCRVHSHSLFFLSSGGKCLFGSELKN